MDESVIRSENQFYFYQANFLTRHTLGKIVIHFFNFQ